MMQKGFTLIEVIVTIGIFSVIVVGLLLFLANSYRSYFSLADSTSALTIGREALERLSLELRGARSSDVGAFAVQSATDNELIFYANVDSATDTERVRYYLQNGSLYRGVIKPTGTPPQYIAGNEVTSILAEFIANGGLPLFEYHSDTFTGTEAPLSNPVTSTDVHYVKFQIIIDEDPNSLPSPITIQSSGTLRNLKVNL